MGVLDDAIRQHIELKRRHGASEDELERKEQEALGPARREVSAEAEDPGTGAGPAGGDSPAVVGDPAAAAEPEDEPFDEPATRVVSPSANEHDGPAPADSPAAAAPDDDDDPEDVLEETPEFLQETPEHERLWFEQKPPRDFDFDDK